MQTLNAKASTDNPELEKATGRASMSFSSGDARKIFNNMSTTNTYTVGGSPNPDLNIWRSSLPDNPIITNQGLATLDNVIIHAFDSQGKQAAVKAVIDSILASQTVKPVDVLVIYRPMTDATDDQGSGASYDLRTANMKVSPRWYDLGQYAQGPHHIRRAQRSNFVHGHHDPRISRQDPWHTDSKTRCSPPRLGIIRFLDEQSVQRLGII
jgi:hypothetical protein